MRPEPGTDGTTPAGPPRGAVYAHVLTLVGAFAFWAWWDRGLWFFGDEWDFLAQRGLWHLPANPASIWFPHNEHWSTLPILLWRALFNIFHLSSYWPYIVPVLVLHAGIMHLSWRLSLRAGVPAGVATAAVGLLGFLGAGAENLTWAFQVGFVGSVFFGLVAMDLLDRWARLRPVLVLVGRRAFGTPLWPSWPASCALRSATPCWWGRRSWPPPGYLGGEPCG